MPTQVGAPSAGFAHEAEDLVPGRGDRIGMVDRLAVEERVRRALVDHGTVLDAGALQRTIEGFPLPGRDGRIGTPVDGEHPARESWRLIGGRQDP